jgi:AcrR family transcriptional regulator
MVMPRGRPREFDAEKALDAALSLFWRHGYEGTSLAALTRAMGINVPSLYAAFGNKEALFKKALERYLQRPASYLPMALREERIGDVVKSLFSGAINMAMNPRHPDGCLLVQGALVSGPDAGGIQKELSRRRAGALGLVRQRFERARAEGELAASVDAGKLARFVVTVIWGLSVQATGGATRGELEEGVEVAMRAWPEVGRGARQRARAPWS